MTAQRFEALVEPRANGGIALRIPFDPDEAWGGRVDVRAQAIS